MCGPQWGAMQCRKLSRPPPPLEPGTASAERLAAGRTGHKPSSGSLEESSQASEEDPGKWLRNTLRDNTQSSRECRLGRFGCTAACPLGRSGLACFPSAGASGRQTFLPDGLRRWRLTAVPPFFLPFLFGSHGAKHAPVAAAGHRKPTGGRRRGAGKTHHLHGLCCSHHSLVS